MDLPQNIFNILYPIGAYYITEGESPQSIFSSVGITSTWTKVQGRFLLGTSSTYGRGAEGGEERHTLTVNEMPAHSHTFQAGSSYQQYASNLDYGDVRASSRSTGSTGGSQPHNNMPPYRAVDIWRRTT